MIKVFIDGREGTTGLRIQERLEKREELKLLCLPQEKRKDLSERRKMFQEADIVFLCLPDQAAREAVSAIKEDKEKKGKNPKIIDTSTAHRTSPRWAYGFPELSEEHRRKIITGTEIAVPGCHASGFHALIYPLISSGIMPADTPVICFSITGYSGGGKKMIAQYQDTQRSKELDSPRIYGLNQQHKHLKEMKEISHLASFPIFSPIVADYYSGMLVSIPIETRNLKKFQTIKTIRDFFYKYYEKCPLIQVDRTGEVSETGGFLASNTLAGKDSMEIFVTGAEERMVLMARFDNLGKGASGAAIQCMNLMIGAEETRGLE